MGLQVCGVRLLPPLLISVMRFFSFPVPSPGLVNGQHHWIPSAFPLVFGCIPPPKPPCSQPGAFNFFWFLTASGFLGFNGSPFCISVVIDPTPGLSPPSLLVHRSVQAFCCTPLKAPLLFRVLVGCGSVETFENQFPPPPFPLAVPPQPGNWQC